MKMNNKRARTKNENVVLSLGVAILFCVVLSACFIQSAWALSKEDSNWSDDETAYAHVKGNYMTYYFYEEYHYGSVIFDPQVVGAWTEFEGTGLEPYCYYYDLQPGQYKSKTKTNSVHTARTTTYSGCSAIPLVCTAKAKISVAEP